MFLKSDVISAKHGFFTRQGGVSTGDYASLNCGLGSGDDIEKVKQNRAIVASTLHCPEVITVKQTHSDVAAIINGPADHEADALVTDKFGLPLAILTADCTPVLFYDERAAVIGAAHAGWRGARFGIIGSTIRAMQNLGAENINAVIGPCIQQQSYEVNEDFFKVMLTEAQANNKFFIKGEKPAHYMFDLPGYVEHKLRKHGVEKIDNLKQDTLTQPDKFFSYRRTTHEGKKDYGRQISVICL